VSSDYPYNAPPQQEAPQAKLPLPSDPHAQVPSPAREWIIPGILFAATIISTSFAGLFYESGDADFFEALQSVILKPYLLLGGLPFSLTLITVLLAHEMGHFLACRYYGIRCTPPFFIPIPISIAGTLGAFIRIKSPFPNRKALFDVGIAGPLAGFLFLLPALIAGISFSELIPKGGLEGGLYFGEPLLFRWIGHWVLGYSPATQDMMASPIAMAAWIGLLATSLNLLPIWQLDGGHIAYAVLGWKLQRKLSIVAVVALMLVSLAGWPFPSYLLFGLLLLFLGMRSRFYHPPVLSEGEEIGRGRVALGIVALIILILCFTPVPILLG
jgi:membrane-associated protease RseP (regulator of RpoE activity)